MQVSITKIGRNKGKNCHDVALQRNIRLPSGVLKKWKYRLEQAKMAAFWAVVHGKLVKITTLSENAARQVQAGTERTILG